MKYEKYAEIQYDGVISFKTELDEAMIPYYIHKIEEVVQVLNTEVNGKILFRRDGGGRFEFIVPVSKPVSTCEHYEYKPVFRLKGLLTARHYDKFEKIKNTFFNISDFMKENNLKAVTKSYFVMENEYCYTIYIGINSNIC